MQTYPACKEFLVSIQHNFKFISKHVSVNFLSGVKEGFEINTALIFTLIMLIMTNCTLYFCGVLFEFKGENSRENRP